MKKRFVVVGYTNGEITHVKWLMAHDFIDACFTFNKWFPHIRKIKARKL